MPITISGKTYLSGDEVLSRTTARIHADAVDVSRALDVSHHSTLYV
jgi:hypothetical protein